MKNIFFSLDRIINWLIIYRYELLFPVAIIEGPIITILAGFLSSLGYFNIFVLYGFIILCDITSDIIMYSLSRFWGKPFVDKFGHYFGVTKERLFLFGNHFMNHSKKSLIIGKLTLGIGPVALIAAGMTKMPFRRFISICFLTSLPKSLVLILIGFYFGKAYVLIDTYLNYMAFAIMALTGIIILIYLVMNRINKKILNGS